MKLSADPDASALSQRLERLERTNRRYRLGLLAAALSGFAWAACSLGPQAKTTLSAERFVLLGPDGSEKAVLEVDPKGNPWLTMKNGAATAVLTTEGPSVLLRAADGKTGAYLGVDGKLSTKLELSSHRVVDGLRLVTHADGSNGVYALDVDGRTRGSLEAFGAGGASLNFRDGKGALRGHLGVDENSLPGLVLLDENGARRIGVLVSEEGHGALEVADAKGQPRMELTTIFDGSPRLELKREDGSPSFVAP